jgi:hypothetical protein
VSTTDPGQVHNSAQAVLSFRIKDTIIKDVPQLQHLTYIKPDDLPLLLVQHWARDVHLFATEDGRYDVAQSYMGGRPAEFVHFSKSKASEDPLGEAEETNKRRPRAG